MWILKTSSAMTCAQLCATQTVLTACTVVCAANYTCAWADETFQELWRHWTGKRFPLFLSHPCSSGDQMFGLVTCDDIHTFVCHWARLVSSSKLALHGGSFANDVFFLLTSFNHKRLRLEWAFSLSHEMVYLPLLHHNVENCFLPNSKQGEIWVISC